MGGMRRGWEDGRDEEGRDEKVRDEKGRDEAEFVLIKMSFSAL